jgi:hypothetical protein
LHAVNVILVIFGGLLLARSLGRCSVPAVGIVNAQGFDRGLGQFGGALRLGLAADVASAVWFAAVTGLGVSTIAVHIVIENQLLARPDGAQRKNAHAQLITHHPLVHVTVGIARVVAEPAKVTFLRCVDKLALCERHKIEMLNAFLVVL